MNLFRKKDHQKNAGFGLKSVAFVLCSFHCHQINEMWFNMVATPLISPFIAEDQLNGKRLLV